MSPIDAARAYVDHGLQVVPCRPGTKRPLTAHGFHDALDTPEQVELWWSQRPDANVGIVTGGSARHGTGIDVVDVDVDPAGTGFAAIERAQRHGLLNGWSALVRTPSGGLHIYYPADPLQRCWSLPNVHVDFRGTGGYIIAPPSSLQHRGKDIGYRLQAATTAQNEEPIAADALRSLLDPRPTAAPRNDASRTADSRIEVNRLARWVATRPEGGRNTGLYWAACRYAEAGIDDRTAHDILGDSARRAGLNTTEAAATIRSAYRGHATQPAPVDGYSTKHDPYGPPRPQRRDHGIRL